MSLLQPQTQQRTRVRALVAVSTLAVFAIAVAAVVWLPVRKSADKISPEGPNISGESTSGSNADNNIDDLPVPPISSVLNVPLTVGMDNPPASELTDDDLVHLASNFRVIGNRASKLTPEQIDRIHEINPDTSVSYYLNVRAGWNLITNDYKKKHPDQVIKNAKGETAKSFLTKGDKSITMDPGNPEWRAFLVDAAVEAVTTGKHDIVMADETKIVNTFSSEWDGINPRTGNIYTDAEWNDDMYGLLNEINVALGADKILVANSAVNGVEYFKKNAARFLEVTDGLVFEGAKGPIWWDTTHYPKEDQWIQNLQVMDELGALGKNMLYIAKYDVSTITSDEDLNKHEMFNFATFMLGKNDTNVYSFNVFDKSNPLSGMIEFQDYWLADLGAPLGAYYKKDDLYQRDFENGRVIVNATKSRGQLDLAGTFYTYDGTPVTVLDVEPTSGYLLLSSPPTNAPTN